MEKHKTGLNKEEELARLNKLEFKTPMMQQYLQIKKEYADCLVLFRLGDFYELFLKDAKIAAEILGITLTTRSRGKDGDVPMCGVPYHALDSYLGKLVKHGYKAAICEQMENASETSGMVDRQVVRVVTPGTVLDDKNLKQKENNFILGIEFNNKKLGLAYADLSTGELYLRQLEYQNLEKDLAKEILRINPAEVISSHQNYNSAKVLRALRVSPDANIYPFDNWESTAKDFQQTLYNHFDVQTLAGFGIKPEKEKTALKAAGALITYLKQTQKSNLSHIKKITPYQTGKFLHLDSSTITNLELFATMRGDKNEGTLINVLDNTHTAGGGRKLRRWLLQPLTNKKQINNRLSAVATLKKNLNQRNEIQQLLAQILDMERLISRVSIGTANPRDLTGLKNSLENSVQISQYLENNLPKLSSLFPAKLSKELQPAISLINKKIKPDPPATLSNGGYIASGVSQQLDQYREVLSGSEQWLENFEKQEQEKTGIQTLKIDQNKVYGFYIQVSKANTDKVPDRYIRKQTLVNSERYIVPELKAREEKTLQAEEASTKLERKLFEQTLTEVLEHAEIIQTAAQAVAKIDVFCSLAETAQKQRYIKPKVVDQGGLEINKGRHPVIEALQTDEPFVPNDTVMNSDKRQILIITGPNMAGKSTYLRQVALITLMAQIGSFVPADQAQIPIRDQIFTRVGASDNISLGQSTFLVEMIETANILNNCTPKSLIILDEVGRGTSTFDGMSIAWAVVEHLAKNKTKQSLTLFATHYHELTNLAQKYQQIKNLQMAIKKENQEIVFLHQVVPGGTWKSYGIEVARLAGLPESVIKKAQYMLQKTKKDQKDIYRSRNSQAGKTQINMFKEPDNDKD